MKMSSSPKRRCFTLMIVPHSEDKCFSFRLPLYIVQGLAIAVVLAIAGFCVLGYSYIRTAAEASEAQELREVNRAQQDEINALALETHNMMEQLRGIDELVELVTDILREDAEINELLQENSNVLVNSNAVSGPNVGLPQENDAMAPTFSRSYSSRSSSSTVFERASTNLEVLRSVVPERTEALDLVGEYAVIMDAKPSIWPTRGRISSGFGSRRSSSSESGYRFHSGVDIINAHGAEIWATAPGEVTFTGYYGGYGHLVIVDHGYNYSTYYAHLSGYAVEKGDHVERGDLVGYMGRTGRTTGTHLHYEVRYEGRPINPNNFMKQQE